MIDGAIFAFQGCIYFRVYMKQKVHKYGIKIFYFVEQIVVTCIMEVYAGTHPTDPSVHSV
jgi:hypothetical protein